MEYARPELIAEPDWLIPALGRDDIRVVDCGDARGYARAHIPGAVSIEGQSFIKEAAADDRAYGIHIMSPDEFSALMGRLGIGAGTTVVAYDDDMNHVAPRLWWALRYYGHDNVRVLNGDWHRWVEAGYPVTDTVPEVESATFRAEAHPERIAMLSDVLEASQQGEPQILDTRSRAEYEGTNDRGNRRAGRVPGAQHLEWKAFVRAEGDHAFRPAEEMQSLVDDAGIERGKPVITYCQGGIRAAHSAFALELLGYDGVQVYDGSMGEWANRDDTPLER